jgi:hypothetical protein
MTPDDPLTRLEAFGYTPRQAAFLRLVLLFGGYFVRRHVTTFFGGGDGGITTDFVRTLVARGHATCGTYRRKTQVVHVFAKRLYAALGEPDNRNRRTAEPASIVRKLLTLDLVLAHRCAPFLATTREKIASFRARGIPLDAFPTVRYHARRHPGPPTLRHFVDKAPIWVGPDGSTVVFAYVRTPLEGTDGLRTWLAAYAPLLAWLPAPCLLLVAASAHDAAESVAVATTLLPATTVELTSSAEEQRTHVERYFEARRRVEQGDLGQVTAEDLAHVRVLQAHFSDGVHESLYRAYLSWGPMVLSHVPAVQTSRNLTHVALAQEVIPVRYELYGTCLLQRPRARSSGTVLRRGGMEVSGEFAA